MFDKLTEFLDKRVSTPMAKLSEQKHLAAVRDGIIATLPLIIVGSFFLILANPPLPEDWGIYKFLVANSTVILLPYRMTMYIMALYAAFGIGNSLAKSYNLDGLTGGILGALAFLLTFVPINVTETSGVEYLGKVNGESFTGLALPMTNLGGGGLFVAILTSLIAVEVYRILHNSKFRIKMPDQVPDSVARSFEALTPVLVIILVIGGITYFAGFDWHSAISTIIQPIVKASDSLPSVWLVSFLNSFFWSFGIHGSSVVNSIAQPIWLQLLEANSAAQAAGSALPAVAAEPFYQWFIFVGGSGCTIGLSLLMLFRARSSYLKSLGRAVALPSIFNINEPLVFGAPIVLNPILMIPFIISPIVMGTVSWIATSLGFVNQVVAQAPWTLPGPIGAYLATGGDFRAIILNLVCIIIAIVIYYPFFRMYDKNMLKQEQEDSVESVNKV